MDRLKLIALVDPAGFPFNSLLKHISNLTLTMFNDTWKAFREKDSELINDVVDNASEAIKLYRLMVRQLMLAYADRATAKNLGIESSTECIILAVMARDVSRLIYHISSIAKHVKWILENGSRLDEKLTDSISKIWLYPTNSLIGG